MSFPTLYTMILLLAVFSSSFLLVQATATCYFPDGDISPADVPCEAEASDSVCCYSRQACLSNKICLTGTVDGVDQYARGTCTDQSWLSDACPDFCLDQQALGNVMYSCNITGADQYCCNEGCSCDANAGEEVISFTGTPYTISVIGVTSAYANPSATAPSSVSSTPGSSSAETSPSPSSSTPPSPPSSASPSIQSSSSARSTSNAAAPLASSSISQTADPPPASSDPSMTSTSSGSGSSAVAIGAGVGVGVGVGVLLLGAGAIFLFRRRVRARKNTGTYTDKAAFSSSARSDAPTLPSHQAEHIPKEPLPTSHNASELSSAGHEYSELGADGAQTELPARKSDIAELPGR